MIYNTLGRSGLKASEIGLGCEHLEGQSYEVIQSVVDAALANGINILDVFMSEPQVRSHIGRALEGRRDQVLIQGHFGARWKDGQYGRTRQLAETQFFFEDLLTRLRTDYIDIGMFHCVDTDEEFDQIFANGVADYAQDLKKKGVVRALGISTHDPAIGLRAVETGLMDVILFSINPAYDLLPDGLGSTQPLFDADTYKQPLLGMHPLRQVLRKVRDGERGDHRDEKPGGRLAAGCGPLPLRRGADPHPVHPLRHGPPRRGQRAGGRAQRGGDHRSLPL